MRCGTMTRIAVGGHALGQQPQQPRHARGRLSRPRDPFQEDVTGQRGGDDCALRGREEMRCHAIILPYPCPRRNL